MELLKVYLSKFYKNSYRKVRVFYFCQMKDFIIVGAGIAGISFAETAYIENRSFTVITDSSQNSSFVAAGIYNPVILKRFSLPMDSKRHLEYSKSFYDTIQKRLSIKFDYNIPVYRKFTSFEEQNNWFEASDKITLAPFLSPELVHKTYKYLPALYGFGRVLHTGYIDTEVLLNNYHKFLYENGNLINERFDFDEFAIGSEYVTYKGIKAKHIVFAEGFGIHNNPYFNYLPLDGTKGELLLIRAPLLKLDVIINGGIFIFPLGNDIYKVGATYEWYDKSPEPTEAGKNELVGKLDELITCNYEVIGHYAGIRPTVKDRKALIGTHPEYSNVHLLNGLGTRGVMLGPPLAKDLYNCIINGNEIDKSVNLTRFKR